MTRVYTSPVRAEQSEATRQRIVDAVVHRLSQGDTNWSVQDIADEAGVSARTVYRHFASRDELVDGVLGWVNDVIADRRPASDLHSADDLADAAAPAFGFIAEHQDLYRVVLTTALGRASHRRTTGRREAELRAALAEELAGLGKAAGDRLLGITHLLSSSQALLFLDDYWGLDSREAARAVGWAVRVLAAAATDPAWQKEL